MISGRVVGCRSGGEGGVRRERWCGDHPMKKWGCGNGDVQGMGMCNYGDKTSIREGN